jgi:hypothetical protein
MGPTTLPQPVSLRVTEADAPFPFNCVAAPSDGILPPLAVATPAEQLLLRHPGDRVLVVPKAKASLARELEAAGLVRLSVARTGAISLGLTEAGERRREELQLESIGRAAPPSEPRPSARKKAAPRATPAPAPPPAPSPRKVVPPTKRAASLDDLFGQGAFHPAPDEDDARPITTADLRALEERLVTRFRQALDEALGRGTRRG